MKRFIVALFTLTLAACNGTLSSVPGAQTLGMAPDPDAGKKAILVVMDLAVQGVGAYGHLCVPVQTLACKSPQAYVSAKLVAKTIVGDAQLVATGNSGAAVVAATVFAFTQYQIIKTMAGEGGKTDPLARPSDASIEYVKSIQAAGLLATTADAQVRDAFSVNTSVAELMAKLQADIDALP